MSSDLIIPVWAVVIISVIFLPWLIWLTVETFHNKKDIAVNTSNDEKVSQELDKIYKKLDETRTDFKEWFQKLENKMDSFIISRTK